MFQFEAKSVSQSTAGSISQHVKSKRPIPDNCQHRSDHKTIGLTTRSLWARIKGIQNTAWITASDQQNVGRLFGSQVLCQTDRRCVSNGVEEGLFRPQNRMRHNRCKAGERYDFRGYMKQSESDLVHELHVHKVRLRHLFQVRQT
jgi:hypothetical protein